MDWSIVSGAFDLIQNVPVVGEVTTAIGTITAGLGLTLPFTKKGHAKPIGKAVGALLGVIFVQRVGAMRRWSSTLEEFSEGVVEGLPKAKKEGRLP